MNRPTLMTVHKGIYYYPAVEGKVQWSTEREGAAGSLTFDCIKDKVLVLENGDPVYFSYGSAKIFYGFVFEINRKSDPILTVKAYDQLRYFKNKDYYSYKNKTTGELLKMIATDFRLNVGTLADTGYPITRSEDNHTLFDIVDTSLDLTLKSTGKMFVLYDDFGALTLKNISNMAYNLLIDQDTAQDYSYTKSIDKNTYNKVKLIKEDSSTKARKIYIAQSSENMNKWGVLQYTDKVADGQTGSTQADQMLNLYNAETKTLSISNAFGDVNIRAGCLLVVQLDLGDGTQLSNLMLVEKCKHTFSNSEHWMDLTLRGGEMSA